MSEEDRVCMGQRSVQPGDDHRCPKVNRLPPVGFEFPWGREGPFFLKEPEGEGRRSGGYDHDPRREDHQVRVGADQRIFVGPDEFEGKGGEDQSSSQGVEE